MLCPDPWIYSLPWRANFNIQLSCFLQGKASTQVPAYRNKRSWSHSVLLSDTDTRRRLKCNASVIELWRFHQRGYNGPFFTAAILRLAIRYPLLLDILLLIEVRGEYSISYVLLRGVKATTLDCINYLCYISGYDSYNNKSRHAKRAQERMGTPCSCHGRFRWLSRHAY